MKSEQQERELSFLGDHLIFRRTKGGISENLGKIQRGLFKFSWTMKTMGGGGITKVINSFYGGITSVK